MRRAANNEPEYDSGDIAHGFMDVPVEVPKNVLDRMACVILGGPNTNGIGKAETGEGEVLRGDGAPSLAVPRQTWHSTRASPTTSGKHSTHRTEWTSLHRHSARGAISDSQR